MTILQRIEAARPDLSRAEAAVADWVLGHPRRAVESSIAEAAAAAGVSEPTVIRFCRSLGAGGFRQMKTLLIAALERPESYLHRDVEADDDTMGAVSKVLASSIRALVDLRSSAGTMPFEPAVAALAGARQIVFVGTGASGCVAADACHKYFRLGLPCSTAVDSPTIVQRAAIAQPGDAFVAVSHTGTRPETVAAMGQARRRGATVIAVTDPGSPLQAAADWTFPCHPAEDTSVYTPMSSRLAQLALLDALQVALALRLGDPAARNLRLSKAALRPASSPDAAVNWGGGPPDRPAHRAAPGPDRE